MVYTRTGEYPEEDNEMVLAVRHAGRTVEERKRSKEFRNQYANNRNNNGNGNGKSSKTKKGDKSGKTQKGNQEAVPSGSDQTEQKADQAKDKGKKKKERLWKGPKEALEGIPQAEIDTNKEKGADCWRCGRDGHSTFDCFARQSLAGTELPIHPSRQKDSASAVKRKRNNEKKPAAATPPAKKANQTQSQTQSQTQAHTLEQADIAAAVLLNRIRAQEQAKAWELRSSEEPKDF
jgi:hypothetical protein